MLDRLIRIEEKVDVYRKTGDKVEKHDEQIIRLEQKVDRQQEEIDELKDRNKWLARTIVGAVIGIGVSLVAIFIKLGMGL